MSRSQRRSASRGIGPHRPPRTGAMESLSLMLRAQLTATTAATEPFREAVCQYTDMLCTTKKQTNQ